jgi:hypothetical protein
MSREVDESRQRDLTSDDQQISEAAVPHQQVLYAAPYAGASSAP